VTGEISFRDNDSLGDLLGTMSHRSRFRRLYRLKMGGLQIAVAGPALAGKSALLQRYTTGNFDYQTRPTSGLDIAIKSVDLANPELWNHFSEREQKTISNILDTPTGTRVKFWDFCGQERVLVHFKKHFTSTSAVMLVYDLHDPDSILALSQLMPSVGLFLAGKPVILVGAKADLLKRTPPEQVERFLDIHAVSLSLETSAKTGFNVDQAFKAVIKAALELSYT